MEAEPEMGEEAGARYLNLNLTLLLPMTGVQQVRRKMTGSIQVGYVLNFGLCKFRGLKFRVQDVVGFEAHEI